MTVAAKHDFEQYFIEEHDKRRKRHIWRKKLLEQLEAEAHFQKKQHEGHEYAVTFPYLFERTDKKKLNGWQLKYPKLCAEKNHWHWRAQPMKFTTPNRLGKFSLFCRIFINPWFSLGCGLTVAGSLLAALIMFSGGTTVLLPFLLSTAFLFLIAWSNWKTIQKRVPEMLHAMFARKFFKRLFQYSAEEYKDYLREYWIDMDDRIAINRRIILDFRKKIASGKPLSLLERRKLVHAKSELIKLVDRRNASTLPPRDLSRSKRWLIIAAQPFNLAGGFMIGVLTFNLSLTTIINIVGLLPGSAAAAVMFATPPGWMVAAGLLLAIVTAATMTGFFAYGSSCLAKLFKPRRKMRHFVSNLFKEKIRNPNGPGMVRVYTWKGVLKGVFKSLIITAFVGLVLMGNFSQMFGGAYLLNEFMTGQWGLVLSYVLPSMAMVVQTPFYIQQSAKFARSWFKNKLNYFRHPLKVIDKNIKYFENMSITNSIGPGKARMMINKLKRERFEIIRQEKAASKQRHFWIIPGSVWVKLPHWARDILKFKLTKTMNAVGKGFLSYWGAMTDGGISLPDDGGHVPDAFFVDVDDSYELMGGTLRHHKHAGTYANYKPPKATGKYSYTKKHAFNTFATGLSASGKAPLWSGLASGTKSTAPVSLRDDFSHTLSIQNDEGQAHLPLIRNTQ